MEVYSMGKTATLNIRVNPDVKENAESVLMLELHIHRMIKM